MKDIEISRDKKNPIYRPIETIEDYNEAVKDKDNFVLIAKDESYGINLSVHQIDKENNKIYFHRYSNEYIYDNFLWLDDQSPVGVKCS